MRASVRRSSEFSSVLWTKTDQNATCRTKHECTFHCHDVLRSFCFVWPLLEHANLKESRLSTKMGEGFCFSHTKPNAFSVDGHVQDLGAAWPWHCPALAATSFISRYATSLIHICKTINHPSPCRTTRCQALWQWGDWEGSSIPMCYSHIPPLRCHTLTSMRTFQPLCRVTTRPLHGMWKWKVKRHRQSCLPPSENE